MWENLENLIRKKSLEEFSLGAECRERDLWLKLIDLAAKIAPREKWRQRSRFMSWDWCNKKDSQTEQALRMRRVSPIETAL